MNNATLHPPIEAPRHSFLWFWVWFGLAALMLVLVIITQAAYQTIGLCFLAWCGGVVSTLMVQERFNRRKEPHDRP